MKLVAIGFLGSFVVYINHTKEEAVARYNQDNPDYKVEDCNLTVREVEVKDGKFHAYDIFEED